MLEYLNVMIAMVKGMMKMSVFVLMMSVVFSCDFLDVEPPNSKIPAELVFTDDITATSAIAGVYLEMLFQSHFASGTQNGIVSLAGLSADELMNIARTPEFVQYENNNLDAENTANLNLWNFGYKTIYQANAILKGLSESTGVTPNVKDQLRGEALFIRAFCHFYLVNSFGDIPIILTTDYTDNAVATRKPVDEVYDQILIDLQEAESLMTESYVTAGRVRPNKYAATAMMARVYLYKEDWPRAEDKASNVIARADLYNVASTTLNNVFLSASKEAIWQIRVPDGVRWTNEGYFFGTNFAHNYNVLDSAILDAFEPNDLRRTSWITSKVESGIRLYYPFKYKIQSAPPTGPESNEYSTPLRLAEQHLIRAEARAHQPGKLVGFNSAQSDINIIRARAGLPNTTAVTETQLLDAIDRERRIELLVEWGHRWFDLKRRNLANTVLASKPGWSSDDQLYPLPGLEMRNNPKLRPQNPGY